MHVKTINSAVENAFCTLVRILTRLFYYMKVKFIHLFLFPVLIFCQNEKPTHAFDSIFYHISVNLVSFDSPKAMLLADSLYNYASTKKERYKSLMLKADILERKADHGEAIQHASSALKLAEQHNDFNYQARIYSFLSRQYRTIGFRDKGKASLKKGIAVSLNSDDENEVINYRAMADQEMAEYALEENHYEQAIAYLQLAIFSYKREDNSKFRNLNIGKCQEMLGRANMALHNSKEALEYFRQANHNIAQADAADTAWAAHIYKGLGEAFMAVEKIDSAQIYLEKALTIAERCKQNSLKQSVYKSVSEFYKQRQMMDSFVVYNSKFNKILESTTAKKKVIVNNAYRTLDVYTPSTFLTKNTYSIIGANVIVIALIVGVVFITKKKQTAQTKSEHKTNENKSTELVLSQKKEEEILKKLSEFEDSGDFLDKDISLSVLIARMNTNTKYLRQVLKKHRHKDYTHYINKLRITYIVQKLNAHPEYLTYKISYLADECGFSSHSKFSANFKRVMHISPSEFIENLKNKNGF